MATASPRRRGENLKRREDTRHHHAQKPHTFGMPSGKLHVRRESSPLRSRRQDVSKTTVTTTAATPRSANQRLPSSQEADELPKPDDFDWRGSGTTSRLSAHLATAGVPPRAESTQVHQLVSGAAPGERREGLPAASSHDSSSSDSGESSSTPSISAKPNAADQRATVDEAETPVLPLRSQVLNPLPVANTPVSAVKRTRSPVRTSRREGVRAESPPLDKADSSRAVAAGLERTSAGRMAAADSSTAQSAFDGRTSRSETLADNSGKRSGLEGGATVAHADAHSAARTNNGALSKFKASEVPDTEHKTRQKRERSTSEKKEQRRGSYRKHRSRSGRRARPCDRDKASPAKLHRHRMPARSSRERGGRGADDHNGRKGTEHPDKKAKEHEEGRGQGRDRKREDGRDDTHRDRKGLATGERTNDTKHSGDRADFVRGSGSCRNRKDNRHLRDQSWQRGKPGGRSAATRGDAGVLDSRILLPSRPTRRGL